MSQKAVRNDKKWFSDNSGEKAHFAASSHFIKIAKYRQNALRLAAAYKPRTSKIHKKIRFLRNFSCGKNFFLVEANILKYLKLI